MGRTPEELAALPTITPEQIKNLRKNVRPTKILSTAELLREKEQEARKWTDLGRPAHVVEGVVRQHSPTRETPAKHLSTNKSIIICVQGRAGLPTEDPQRKLAEMHIMMNSRFPQDLEHEAGHDAQRRQAARHQQQIRDGKALTQGEQKIHASMVNLPVAIRIQQIAGLDHLGEINAQTVEKISAAQELIANARDCPEVLTMKSKLDREFDAWHGQKDILHPHRSPKPQRNVFELP